jgi:hypothetical protein
MNPPFSGEEFFGVFAAYNTAVWPLQIVLLAVTLLALTLLIKDAPWRGRAMSLWLAVLWGWMAIGYHWRFFSEINPAARLFAGAFLLQALLILWFGFRPGGLRFRLRDDSAGYAGGFLVTYALFAYPLIGIGTGQTYPALPTFGLPCPTTIFTLGVFLWLVPTIPWALLVIPSLWALVAISAAVDFGVTEDLMLPVAALLALAMAAWQRLRERKGTSDSIPPLRHRDGPHPGAVLTPSTQRSARSESGARVADR